MIAYYCSKQCQRWHWGKGEHKLFCLSPEERTLKAGEAAIAAEEEEEEEEEARTATATAVVAVKLAVAVTIVAIVSHGWNCNLLFIFPK